MEPVILIDHGEPTHKFSLAVATLENKVKDELQRLEDDIASLLIAQGLLFSGIIVGVMILAYL